MSTGVPRGIVEEIQHPLSNADEYAEVVRIAGMKSPWPLVFLHGPNGNGKTHMGSYLYHIWHLRQLVGFRSKREQGLAQIGSNLFQPRAKWITEHDLTAGLKNFSRDGFDYQREFQALLGYDLLYIDDIITEKTTDTDLSNITEIISARNTGSKPTIITSNKDPLAIEQNYSRRLAERLVVGEVVNFEEGSFRMKKYMER